MREGESRRGRELSFEYFLFFFFSHRSPVLVSTEYFSGGIATLLLLLLANDCRIIDIWYGIDIVEYLFI